MCSSRFIAIVLGTALTVPLQAIAATLDKDDPAEPATTSNANAWQFEITPPLSVRRRFERPGWSTWCNGRCRHVVRRYVGQPG